MPITVHEYLAGLKGKTVAVIGIGVSNTPRIKMLLRAGVRAVSYTHLLPGRPPPRRTTPPL